MRVLGLKRNKLAGIPPRRSPKVVRRSFSPSNVAPEEPVNTVEEVLPPVEPEPEKKPRSPRKKKVVEEEPQEEVLTVNNEGNEE